MAEVVASAVLHLVRAVGQLSYLSRDKSYIMQMAFKAEILEDVKREVQQLVDAARNNSQDIGEYVQSWLDQVERTQDVVRPIIEDELFADDGCLNRWCLNLKSRSLRRKFWRVNDELDEILEEADFFVASFPYRYVASTSTGGSKGFPSRMIMAQEIVGALESHTFAIIGICGMEGVGKTIMVREIMERVRSKALFDVVAMLVVSENTDVIAIQDRLAKKLGLKLPKQENTSARAQLLRTRIMNGERILLVLDDVWEELDMGAIGIPTGDGSPKGCKVVFTSRNEDVCGKMGSRTFRIGPLSDEEAWDLLKARAGECVDSPNLYPVTREVAKICEGLPLHIVTWGWRLRDREVDAWVVALQELRKSARTKNSGSDTEVYLTIESIYVDLKKVEAKSLFRLCCRFPKDEKIMIELLIRYGVGLQLFEGDKTLVEAREGVHLLVKELIGYELLVEGGHEGFVKVPDVAWDVGRNKSSAQEVKNEYLLLHGNGLKESSENDKFDPYTAISIYSTEMHELPDYLDCAQLKLLSFEWSHDKLEISGDFFEGMNDLQVMDLKINSLEPLPPSIKFLRNLRTLYLDFCILGDISLIGGLHKLEILSFFRSKIGELPREIRKLSKLKLLDLRCRSGPSIIRAGILSGLKGLEELYTGNYFNPRNVVEENKGKGAKAVELNSLSCLKALQISMILNNEFLQKFTKFEFKNLKGFDFSMFDVESLPVPRYHFSNSVALYGVEMPLVSDNVNELMRKAEGLSLEGGRDLTDLDVIVLDKEVFVNLKRLNMYNYQNVQYLAAADWGPDNVIFNVESLDIAVMPSLTEICKGDLPLGTFEKLEEISLMRLPNMRHLWTGHIQLPSLGNLRVLKMQDCNLITSLFPRSAVNCLIQLEELKITKCQRLKEVVSKEVVDTEKMEFPKLKILSLSRLPDFRSFYPEPNFYRHSYEIADTTEHLFSQQVSLANMEELDVRNLNSHVLILGDQMQAWSFNKLQVLRVFSCIPLRAVFNFERLQLGGDLLEKVMFNRLEIMDLYDLPILSHIWMKVPKGIRGFHNLRALQVDTCGGLTYLLSISMAKMLVSLQDLTIRNCETMREVVGTEEEEEDSSTAEMMDKIVFPKLRFLALEALESLQFFYYRKHDVELPLMKKIFITNCPRMKTFCSGRVTAPKLERINVKAHDLEEWVWKGDLNKTIADLGKRGQKMHKRASH